MCKLKHAICPDSTTSLGGWRERKTLIPFVLIFEIASLRGILSSSSKGSSRHSLLGTPAESFRTFSSGVTSFFPENNKWATDGTRFLTLLRDVNTAIFGPEKKQILGPICQEKVGWWIRGLVIWCRGS